MIDAPSPLAFFDKLRWLDGRPLLNTIEAYRRTIFDAVLYTFNGDRPRYNLAVCGRAKKNWKTSDLILAALYRLLVWPARKAMTVSSSPMTKAKPLMISTWQRSWSPPTRSLPEK